MAYAPAWTTPLVAEIRQDSEQTCVCDDARDSGTNGSPQTEQT